MEYTVIWNGQSYDLPCYSLKISEKLEEIENINRSSAKFREKCKKMYDLAEFVIGKQAVLEILGKFDDSDPNKVNILYLEILKSYNKPLEDYSMAGMEEMMNSDELEKVLEIVKALPQIKEMKESKK